MKNKLLKNLFSSGLQAVAIQLLGVFFFIYLSFHLSKEEFGIISFMNARAMFIITFLSLGMEQIVIRRIASSKSSDWAAAAYLIHAIVSSVVTIAVLYVLGLTITEWKGAHILTWFFTAQALIFMGTPLKQFLNAKEKFAPYGIIAIISNIGKLVLAWFLLTKHLLDIYGVIWILIGCSLFEFIALLIYTLATTSFSFKFRFSAYLKLVKESRAQFLSVIFDSGLSRIDWILLSIISTNAITGDYTFAYRAFELARLPIVIIAPIILSRFSRILATSGKLDDERRGQFNNLLSIEMFLAVCIPLLLNIVWSPFIGYVFDNKYGPSNAVEFAMLSASIPLHFLINLFWTVSFSAKKYRQVSTITIIAAIANLVLNLVLIPVYGGAGAAMAFVVTSLVQAILCYKLVHQQIANVDISPLPIFLICGSLAYITAIYLTENIFLQLLIAIVVYIILSLLTGQLKKNKLRTLKALFS